MKNKLMAPKRTGRRIAKDRRKRAAASCDYCKIKRNKCERPPYDETGSGPCRACEETGIQCRYTIPRKRRVSSDVPGERKYEYVDATFYRVSVMDSPSSSSPRASSPTQQIHTLDDHLPLANLLEPLSSYQRYLQPTLSMHYEVSGNDLQNHHYPSQHQHQHQQSTPFPHSLLRNIGNGNNAFNLIPGTAIDGLDQVFRPNIGDIGIEVSNDPLRLPTPPSQSQDLLQWTSGVNEIIRVHLQRIPEGDQRSEAHLNKVPGSDTSEVPVPSIDQSTTLREDEDIAASITTFGTDQDIILFAKKPKYLGQEDLYAFLLQLRNLFAEQIGHQVIARDSQVQAAIGEIPIFPEDRNFTDGLVEHFFNTVHRDFPIFHKDSFFDTYKRAWDPNAAPIGAGNMLCIYIVFVLSIEDYEIAEETKRSFQDKYVKLARQIQGTVLDGSSLTDVQALALYGYYLYLNGQQSASWNLTGAAVRIAVAINLHRSEEWTGGDTGDTGETGEICETGDTDDAFKVDTIERELRRRVWWTMYMFERIQCALLGRVSCIDDSNCTADIPTDGVLDYPEHFPEGLIQAQISLSTILGTICKRFNLLDALPSDNLRMASEFYERLLVWRDQLPYPLRHGSGLSDTHSRQIYLLHALFHYTVCLLMRPFLSYMASDDWSNGNSNGGLSQSDEHHVRHFSTLCASSALDCKQYMHRLHEMGQFNQRTWLDIYFVYYSSLMLSTQAAVLAKQHKSAEFGSIKEHVMANDILLDAYQEKSRAMERFGHMAQEVSRVLKDVVGRRVMESAPINDGEVSPSITDFTSALPTNPLPHIGEALEH